VIETERLLLRRWTDADRPVFHAQCSDPEVMRFLGPLQTREETDAGLDRQNGFLETHGFCFWAVERREDGALLGFCGLKPGAPDTPIADDVEVGWRFGRAYWGQGYAREAAQASLAWGWANTDAPRIAAITVLANTRSWGLMERLGMARAADEDFDHPAVPEGSPLKRHLVYRIARP
jgi:RimJ/RimL family protein N-acetyltransferase